MYRLPSPPDPSKPPPIAERLAASRAKRRILERFRRNRRVLLWLFGSPLALGTVAFTMKAQLAEWTGVDAFYWPLAAFGLGSFSALAITFSAATFYRCPNCGGELLADDGGVALSPEGCLKCGTRLQE